MKATRSRGISERKFSVDLHGRRVGILHAVDDFSRFVLDPAYMADPERAVLGLRFEEDRNASHRANMRLPPWFSNLLPEGPLRDWIAQQRGVSVMRELELLAEVGTDLPGAVTVRPTMDEVTALVSRREVYATNPYADRKAWRFSLAGVQLKFSMLSDGIRFTAPAVGEYGDWIVKLPGVKFPHVPQNEFAMMDLARRAGIDVPETRLVARDQIASIPSQLWPDGEAFAYAVRRFDRGPDGTRIHMEDLAQVRGFYPENKYTGTFETIANIIYRGRDIQSIEEFIRRLAFNVLVRNADAHLKNWSLLYRDPRIPVLSPAYDLVCTSVYPNVDRDLGLRLGGSKRFEDVTLATFDALRRRLGIDSISFADVAENTVKHALASWPAVEAALDGTKLARPIGETLKASAEAMQRKR